MASAADSTNSNDLVEATTASTTLLRELSFWEIGATHPQPHADSIRDNNKKSNNHTSNAATTTSTTTMKSRYDLEEAAAANWRTATDPATGKIYYYDVITRKTQWEKPKEIRTLEKKRKQDKRERDVAFFREMEANIKASLARGERVPGVAAVDTTTVIVGHNTTITSAKATASKKPEAVRVRTISGMNEHWLAELTPARTPFPAPAATVIATTTTATTTTTASNTSSTIVNPAATTTNSSNKPPRLPPRHPPEVSSRDDGIDEDHEEDAYTSSPSTPGNDRTSMSSSDDNDGEDDMLRGVDFVVERHMRRNTYDGRPNATTLSSSTMDQPDIPATIKAVCGVIRAHILQSCCNTTRPRPVLPTVNIAIFCDNTTELPSVQQVQDFYWGFYRRSQMEFDAIILSLIYVERLIKETEGVLMPSPDNWQSILFSCMVLASKVWDDLSMWNVDFSNVSGNVNFSLKRINELERAVLKCLNYAVVIPASEYAKYYYLLRNMMIRGGMMDDTDVVADACSANRLQDRTRRYQAMQLQQTNDRTGGGIGVGRRAHSVDWTEPVLKEALCMEQLVAGQ